MTKDNPTIIIIGAGMTGIQIAIKLRKQGFQHITILEKSSDLGGTWHHNTYPGIACDVPSHAYTYSFNPNPHWSNHFPKGAEIEEYFKHTCEKFDINRHIRFNTTVTKCRYDEAEKLWSIATDEMFYVADLLFVATGILHQPNIPQFPGMETFEGDIFHTSNWDHTIDYSNKNIGVVGVGSTAAQCIPELAKKPMSNVFVFQRTPQWLINVKDKVFSQTEKQRFLSQPWRMKIVREIALFTYRQNTAALTNTDFFSRLKHKIMWYLSRKNLKDSVEDPNLRAKLTPDYKFGCKRVVINSTFYDAVQKPNVNLITAGIDSFTSKGIVLDDTTHQRLDIIILATGFDPAAFMRPMEFIGTGGLTIDQTWEKKIQAYRSICVPGFPNCFIMLGPNSPIGNYSVIEMAEKQTDYALKLVNEWQHDTIETIEVKTEAMVRWNKMLQSKMKNTVWTSGCNSWYLDADGDPLAWPDSWGSWVTAMEKPNMDDFKKLGG